MNIFSQSKLTLKLKKENNTSSTDLTNKCQKPEIIDSLKTEFLSDNSILSENDSFVEVLHSGQSNKEKLPTSQSVFKTTLSDQNTSNIVNENKQCPVCLQMVDVKKFIIHVKSCGTSHNLSSKVLIKAVDLQERQAAEREALGLPILSKNLDVKKKKKCNANKQTKLKIGKDSNLDLAIAMSVSLQESKNAEIIKESETLLEAGLVKEALEKRKTLENFGFISNQPIRSKPKNYSKANSLLFKQTQEDREKRITEKVAMILIDVDTGASSSELLKNDCPNTIIVSKYLNSIRNIDNKLWKKSLLEEENICEFYVKQLSKFIKPYENNSIIDFKLDTHQNTLKHESIMKNEEFVDKLQKTVDNSNIDNIFATCHNIIGNKTILEYSSKWKSMIGNQFMSDLTIYAKDEHEIPAHTLVFHVQCPDILDDVVTEESDTCKSKKMLTWLEYSSEACLAFLELIYSGQESIIKPEFRKDYLHLGTRYNILMAVNDDEKYGWFSKDADKISKRKNSEFYNNSNDCKRYKASSPDMFMSDDMNVETCSSANFLGTTVNDEKSLSVLKAKQWLYSQHHQSSFTENLVISTPPPTNLPEKSPCHSFHSATTVSLKFSSSISESENNDEQIKSIPDINISSPKPLSVDESSLKKVSVLQNIKNVADAFTTPVKFSKLNESFKEPDLITIDSDSENGSIDMIFCNSIKNAGHNNTFLSQLSIKNEKNNYSFNSSNAKYGNINTIELNDNSLDSIHSACTNVLYQRKYNSKSNQSLFDDSKLNSKDKKININDDSSIFSAITNVLPINNVNTQIFSSNNNVIDLIEDSSDSLSTIDMTLRNNNSIISIPTSLNNAHQNGQSYSTLFSIVTSSKETVSVRQSDSTTQYETNNLRLNSSPLKSNLLSNYSSSKIDENNFTSSNKETSNNFDLNSSNSSSICISPISKDDSKILSKSPIQSFQIDNKSSTFSNYSSPLKMNNTDDNYKSINRIFSNENQNAIEKCNSDSKLFENTLTTSLILPSNNYDDSCADTKEVDLTFFPSSECINKHLIHTNSLQVEPNQLSEIIIPNKNDNELNKSNIEQIIDDPWMDYNDWQAVNFSPQYVSPVLSKSTSMVLVDEPEVHTSRTKNLSNILLLTPSSVSSSSNNINFSNKNSLTPNKYSSRISTPKSLRRVQSESVIGSKQMTPLPDYSSMKTPDLRKEFDRYGLKDLGRRKGKLILRHIFDVLHPLFPSEEDNCNTEFEHYSSSSDISEHGIPDYEDGSFDEIETLNPTNLSNKISVETGFKQLLKTNVDLHKKILCYEPIWIEELKEDLKLYNVNISMQKLMTFLDDKCVTFRSKSLNDQRQKTLSKKSTKRKKLF